MAVKRYETLRDLGILSSLGIMFVLSTFIGLAMGYHLDKWLDTSPYLTILFLLFGIAAAFLSLYREIKRLIKKQEQEDRHYDE
ncbi:AtpZ/AtpI family protein [candidate division CSSED10-310 bacterium]|uniref:AtpZ/AtpI family protein n=1 Tax=candidate division CSSED10-310 bacterium TaxID=2855610 RepID=A0ABV6YVA6_UNCC1